MIKDVESQLQQESDTSQDTISSLEASLQEEKRRREDAEQELLKQQQVGVSVNGSQFWRPDSVGYAYFIHFNDNNNDDSTLFYFKQHTMSLVLQSLQNENYVYWHLLQAHIKKISVFFKACMKQEILNVHRQTWDKLS